MTVSNNDAAFGCCALPFIIVATMMHEVLDASSVGAFGSYTASPLRPAPTLSVRPDGV